MYCTSNNGNPAAWIVNAGDRGRKKIYTNNKVYLDNNQEFQIELFNPLTETILAKININGKPASATGLILRPGQRFYLDCFIDDRKKFVFRTYDVDNTAESLNAIPNNGYVEVSFYKEKSSQIYINNPVITTWIGPIYSNLNHYTTNISNASFTTTSCSVTNTSSLNLNLNQKTRSRSLNETGRVEKGEKSNQKFESLDMDFENFILSKVSYQLIPNSKKPVDTTEIKKNFCSSCGYKLKGTEKFCPSCGTRI